MTCQVTADTLQGLGGDAGPVPEARDELPIVHRTPAERGLGDARPAAKLGDGVEQIGSFLCDRFHAVLLQWEATLRLSGKSTTVLYGGKVGCFPPL